MKILLPSIDDLHPDLPDGVTSAEYDSLDIPPEHRDAEVLVLWGGRPDRIAALPDVLPNLRYIQALAAGPDALLNAGLPAHIRIATGRGLHDRTVTEHALALALRLLTRADVAARAQAAHEWSRELNRVRPVRIPGRVDSIVGAHVLIWGFGSIGQNLARVVDAMGAASVRGVARSAGERAGFEVLTEDSVDEVLAGTDVLFMVLPSGESTDRVLNADRLTALPEHAYVVNVGRGSTVDEAALLDALRSGAIAGAAVDVVATEPLPADSPLWDAPNLLITPHQAGNRADRGAELIATNVRRYLAGESLVNEVDRG